MFKPFSISGDRTQRPFSANSGPFNCYWSQLATCPELQALLRKHQHDVEGKVGGKVKGQATL